MTQARSKASSGSPFEASIGFSRAIRVGNRILVSGTAPVEADGSSTPGDAEAQAARCLQIIVEAVETLGGTAADVVRTRMFLVNPADAAAVGRAHGKIFGDIRPASTMLAGAVLLRPEWLIEIEAEAVLDHA
ncbi:RidA family protein [Sandaracinobacteroides hominis]|uniref:RidA family protein n=1 Tax=Sandaracinobacteroides hominis TaxID=2780086 RepID=UPI0018F39343|nr:RidA family protein [Sandaracinobacteroides hominis]